MDAMIERLIEHHAEWPEARKRLWLSLRANRRAFKEGGKAWINYLSAINEASIYSITQYSRLTPTNR